MESALPILLFLGFLFGSTLLILVCGIQNRAYEDAERSQTLGGLDLYELPRFFGPATNARIANPVTLVVDEADLRSIEAFLRDEMELVELFVGDPTAERLHLEQSEAQRHPGLFERLDGYLAEEVAAAARFVSNPSPLGLHSPRGLALQAVG